MSDIRAFLRSGILPPSLQTFLRVLYDSGKEKTPGRAHCLHVYMCGCGLETCMPLASYLVSLLIDIGCMSYAQQVFVRIMNQTEFSWSLLVSGYIKRGEPHQALMLYDRMQEQNVYPSGHTFVALLNACSQIKNLDKGMEIHIQIARTELLATDLFVGSSLIDMYAKFGCVVRAREVFNSLPIQNVASWTTIISGYARHGYNEEAGELFERMQLEGFTPDTVAYISIIKSYNNVGAIEKAIEIHSEIIKKGFELDCVMGSSLVDMYAQNGFLISAQNVFDRLPACDVVTWTSLIAGYVEHGQGNEALYAFRKMQGKGVSPNIVTFLSCLKACGDLEALEKGIELHAEINKHGFLKEDIVLGNVLIDMYCKFGLLEKAQAVFDELPTRDTITWNTLIGGYIKNGLFNESLDCFEKMQLEAVKPDSITYISALKACRFVKSLKTIRKICAKIAERRFLERDPLLCSTLIDVYAECGSIEKATELFNELPSRDTVSWTAIIEGNLKHGNGEEALNYLRQMHCEGVLPNSVTLVCSLKACGIVSSLKEGQEIHAKICAQSLLENDLIVGNALIDMYRNCGMVTEAQHAFDVLSVGDIVTWNSLILSYADQNSDTEALMKFVRMQSESILPDSITYICILRALGTVKANYVQEMHVKIYEILPLYGDCAVSNALVDAYASCGLVLEAQEVFDSLPVRDTTSWNALIRGYAKYNNGKDTLDCHKQMQLEGVSGNAITFICILKICGNIQAIDYGKEVHVDVAKTGLLEKDILVSNTLMDMYVKCRVFTTAEELFDDLQLRDICSWNVLISGYVKYEFFKKAISCLERMHLEGWCLNSITYMCFLRVFGNLGCINKAQELHAEIVKSGMLEEDLDVGAVLISVYVQVGLLDEAHEIYEYIIDQVPVRSSRILDLCNHLILSYADHGYYEEALKCIERMQYQTMSLDAMTFVCALWTCGCLGVLGTGYEVHGSIMRKGLIEEDIVVGNAVIDMYIKCGLTVEAHNIFDRLLVRNVVTWTTLISGYAEIGDNENIFYLFDEMSTECEPNFLTFVCVLVACSHGGLVDDGKTFFNALSNPSLDHFSCLVDIFGRAGQLDEAITLINNMPFHPTLIIWHTLFGACQKWGNIELAKYAFQSVMQLDEKDVASHVSLSNIHASIPIYKKVNFSI